MTTETIRLRVEVDLLKKQLDLLTTSSVWHTREATIGAVKRKRKRNKKQEEEVAPEQEEEIAPEEESPKEEKAKKPRKVQPKTVCPHCAEKVPKDHQCWVLRNKVRCFNCKQLNHIALACKNAPVGGFSMKMKSELNETEIRKEFDRLAKMLEKIEAAQLKARPQHPVAACVSFWNEH